MRRLRQTSAGAVVFKKSKSNIRVCLIARRKNSRLIWCLPKGHVESGEDLSSTALREVREETGVWCSIISPIGFIRYSFADSENRKRIFKTVHFFLARYLKGKLTDHDHEVEHARWFPISRALDCTEHEGEYQMLKKAERKLKQLRLR